MKNKVTWSRVDEDYYAYYKGEELGFIEYYKKWKKWVWNQREDIIMSLNCLKSVVDALEELENGNKTIRRKDK